MKPVDREQQRLDEIAEQEAELAAQSARDKTIKIALQSQLKQGSMEARHKLILAIVKLPVLIVLAIMLPLVMMTGREVPNILLNMFD